MADPVLLYEADSPIPEGQYGYALEMNLGQLAQITRIRAYTTDSAAQINASENESGGYEKFLGYLGNDGGVIDWDSSLANSGPVSAWRVRIYVKSVNTTKITIEGYGTPFTPSPTPTPTPTPAPDTGPQLQDCVFPTLQWNLIQVLSDLVEWIGCILHNIITILQWVVDWFLHFPDHLDAWASRLFGIDPALPFWDELEKKLIKMLLSAAQQIIDILFADSDYWKGKKYQR